MIVIIGPMDPAHRNSELYRPEFDSVFEALQNPHRRRILLDIHEGDVDDQSDLVDAGLSEIPLHHNHLPRLAYAEFIDWVPETGEIDKGPKFVAVALVLGLIEGDQLVSE